MDRAEAAGLRLLPRPRHVVLGELLSGFTLGNRKADNRRELSELLAAPRVMLLPVTGDFLP